MAAIADGGSGPLGTDTGLGCCGSGAISGVLALRLILLAIRGDLISDRSRPPGVYVNGFLSLVIIAFCIAAGGSYAERLFSGI